MPRRLLLAAFSAAALAILIAAPSAFADALTPESGGSQNADDIDTLYKITFYIGIVIFLLVWGTLIWSLVKYRAKRGGQADQIRGNTPLEIGWTVGRRVDPRGPHRGDLPLPRRHREPARLRPERPERGPGAVRLGRPARPAHGRRPDPAHPRERPAVPLALRLSRRGPALLLRRDGGAHGHDRRARDRGLRRDPLVVDPEVRPEGRRRAGLRERDLVQGRRRRATTAASAPSCAAPTTRTCARKVRGRVAGRVPDVGATTSARRSSRPARRWPSSASSEKRTEGN